MVLHALRFTEISGVVRTAGAQRVTSSLLAARIASPRTTRGILFELSAVSAAYTDVILCRTDSQRVYGHCCRLSDVRDGRSQPAMWGPSRVHRGKCARGKGAWLSGKRVVGRGRRGGGQGVLRRVSSRANDIRGGTVTRSFAHAFVSVECTLVWGRRGNASRKRARVLGQASCGNMGRRSVRGGGSDTPGKAQSLTKLLERKKKKKWRRIHPLTMTADVTMRLAIILVMGGGIF